MKKNNTPSAPKALRAAVYSRQSVTRAQEEFGSTAAQEDMCRAYATSQGWQVVGVFRDENVSGSHMDRPAFQRLMTEVRAGRLDMIVCLRLDRFSRSLKDFVGLIDELQEHNVGFTATQQSFSTHTALGRMVMGLLAVFSEFERTQTAERTKEKIAASRRRGRWAAGTAPFGFGLKDSKLVPIPAEIAVVRATFDAYLNHQSIRRTARYLNELGYRTRSGRRIDANRVVYSLRNVVYRGCVQHEGTVYEGEHDAVIDQETWDRAQALLADHENRVSAPRSMEYLLGGLVTCGCGAKMNGASARGRGGKTFRYYRCPRRDDEGPQACSRKALPAGELEAFVVERIREVTADGRLAEEVAERLAERIDSEQTRLAEKRVVIARTLAKHAERRTKHVESLADLSAAGRQATDEHLGRLADQIEALEAEQAEVERKLRALEGMEADADFVAQSLANFDQIFDALTPDNKFRLVHALVHRVTVDEAKGTIEAELVELGVAEDVEAAS